MELNVRIVGTLRVQKPFALGQINQHTVFVMCNVCRLVFDEVFQLLGVVACDPAGFVEW